MMLLCLGQPCDLAVVLGYKAMPSIEVFTFQSYISVESSDLRNWNRPSVLLRMFCYCFRMPYRIKGIVWVFFSVEEGRRFTTTLLSTSVEIYTNSPVKWVNSGGWDWRSAFATSLESSLKRGLPAVLTYQLRVAPLSFKSDWAFSCDLATLLKA